MECILLQEFNSYFIRVTFSYSASAISISQSVSNLNNQIIL